MSFLETNRPEFPMKITSTYILPKDNAISEKYAKNTVFV